MSTSSILNMPRVIEYPENCIYKVLGEFESKDVVLIIKPKFNIVSTDELEVLSLKLSLEDVDLVLATAKCSSKDILDHHRVNDYCNKQGVFYQGPIKLDGYFSVITV